MRANSVLGDRIAAAALLTLGAASFVGGRALQGRGVQDVLGAGLFPIVLGVGLGICGLGLLLVSLRKARRLRPADKADASSEEGTPGHPRRTWLTLLLLVVYAALLQRAGYLIVTPLFLMAMMAIQGDLRPRSLLVMGVGLTGVLYGIFVLFLGVQIPTAFFLNRY